jgi:hypothetical protein
MTGDPICEANKSRTGFDAVLVLVVVSLPTTVRGPQRAVGRFRAPLSLKRECPLLSRQQSTFERNIRYIDIQNQTSQPTYLLTSRTNDASIAVTYDTPGQLEAPAEGYY